MCTTTPHAISFLEFPVQQKTIPLDYSEFTCYCLEIFYFLVGKDLPEWEDLPLVEVLLNYFVVQTGHLQLFTAKKYAAATEEAVQQKLNKQTRLPKYV